MNLTQLSKKYNTQAKCIRHLEDLRWGKGRSMKVVCPFCNSKRITKRKNSPYYHCNFCNKDFTVMVDTIFEDTRLPLNKWFQLILLMINAKRGISSAQISRDLGITYKTAWYCQMRVRCAMVDPDLELEGMLEMDESFIGGKPRKVYKKDDSITTLSKVTSKRGRGTTKVPVVGLVEKKGKISTKVIQKLSGKNLLSMLKRYANMDESVVITDGYRPYKQFDDVIDHITVTHKEQLAKKGLLNTTSVEGYWSIIKGGIKGNYIVLSKKYLPFYLIEFQYKYNRRNEQKDAFDVLLKRSIFTEKELEYYKPTKQVQSITHPKKTKLTEEKEKEMAI